jgi:hypothetical protein
MGKSSKMTGKIFFLSAVTINRIEDAGVESIIEQIMLSIEAGEKNR